MAKRWYVLACKSHKEHVVQQQLQSLGYEVFYPITYSRNGKTGRLQLKAYFPGYLFVRVDLQEISLSTFQWMPNTEGLVCFGLKPSYVPDPLVGAISKHVLVLSSDGREKTITQAGIRESDEQATSVDRSGTIFDPKLSSTERVQELLRILEGMTVSPHQGD